MKTKKISIHHIYVIIAGLLAGLIVLGGNYFAEKGFSLYEISIFGTVPPMILFGVMLLFNKKYAFKKENLLHLIFYGFIIASVLLAQFCAVILGTPVAVVVFLLYTQPLWTIIFGRIFFKEKITKIRLFACLMVIIGVLFLVNPWNLDKIGSISGIIVSLIGGVALSGWVVQGGNLSKRGNNVINTNFAGNLFGLIFVLLSLPLMKTLTTDESLVRVSINFPAYLWLILIGYGILTQAITPLFYLEGVKKVPIVDAGIILLLEPVSGAILAFILFKQPLTWSIIVGAIFILIANYLIIKQEGQES